MSSSPAVLPTAVLKLPFVTSFNASFPIPVFDEPIFIGRVEMKLNDGKKRKFLYFQSDYKIKTENSQAPGGQDGEGGMIGQPSG